MRLQRYLYGPAAAVLFAACSAPPAFTGTDLGGVDWGADFALQAHTGRRVSTADFRGKIVVLYFGYIRCPDICAPTLAKLAAVRRALGADAERVQVLFVTVDPRRDTPAELAAFAPKFDPSFIGLTGTPGEIAEVAREYKVIFSPAPAATTHGAHAHGQTPVDHSSGMLIKDVNGKLRLFFRNEASVADLEHDVRLLLRERSS